jgi:hypothetical protein
MSWRDIIKVHPACELIPEMSADERKALGEDIKAKGGQPDFPVVFDGDSRLLDGRSRLDAMEEQGLPIFRGHPTPEKWTLVIPWDVKESLPSFDPYAFVLSANVHRRHLNQEQKRETIDAILKAHPEKSDRQIAKEAGTSDKTVAKRRANAESPHKDRREASGRKARGRKPGAKLSVPPPRTAEGKPDCPDCKGEGTLTGIFGSDTKPTTVPCPCTKESAPAGAPEPPAAQHAEAAAPGVAGSEEAAERERIVMRYAEGAKTYAALFKPAAIKAEHITAAREAAKAWEAVAEALSERMIAREAAATTVTEEFPEFPPSLLRPKPEPKKNSDAEAAA